MPYVHSLTWECLPTEHAPLTPCSKRDYHGTIVHASLNLSTRTSCAVLSFSSSASALMMARTLSASRPPRSSFNSISTPPSFTKARRQRGLAAARAATFSAACAAHRQGTAQHSTARQGVWSMTAEPRQSEGLHAERELILSCKPAAATTHPNHTVQTETVLLSLPADTAAQPYL